MIRCLAVDDELLSLDLLEDNIRRVPFLHLAGRCLNAYEAMEIMQREPIDLLFLDIQMPGITGTQFLQSMSTKPMVIFITAYKKYALDGFELDVLDYLVKPVPFERFLKAVNKAADYHALKNQALLKAVQATPVEAKALAGADYFFVNVEYNLVRITSSEICFIEGLKDYIKIYLQNNPKPIVTRLPMKTLTEKLSPARFVRVHKSYIVALVIAVPVASYYMYNWLQHYEYHTPLSWWIFGITALGALLITLLTVSYQAISAALTNPVKCLRME